MGEACGYLSYALEKMSDIAIIIPTYNAAEGIAAEIEGIKRIVPQASIYIVDDSSPDKTAEIVNSTFAGDKRIKVLVRKGKLGRGSAVIAGFQEALKNKDIQYFIEMDADLCHDPKYIQEMIKTSRERKADIVIASKYHPQSTIAGLTFKRIFMSKLMNLSARLILQVPVSDYSNGYRCYNRKAVAFLARQRFTSCGFVVLSEIVYRSHKKGFTIAEIPFDFRQVSTGKTNLNFKEIKEAAITLLKLRFSKIA